MDRLYPELLDAGSHPNNAWTVSTILLYKGFLRRLALVLHIYERPGLRHSRAGQVAASLFKGGAWPDGLADGGPFDWSLDTRTWVLVDQVFLIYISWVEPQRFHRTAKRKFCSPVVSVQTRTYNLGDFLLLSAPCLLKDYSWNRNIGALRQPRIYQVYSRLRLGLEGDNRLNLHNPCPIGYQLHSISPNESDRRIMFNLIDEVNTTGDLPKAALPLDSAVRYHSLYLYNLPTVTHIMRDQAQTHTGTLYIINETMCYMHSRKSAQRRRCIVLWAMKKSAKKRLFRSKE